MAGSERCQPTPKGPLPPPESYESESCGPRPERPGLVAIGTVTEPVPETGFALNFSLMPRIAPPTFGSEIDGTGAAEDCGAVDSAGAAPAMRCAGGLPTRR